MLQHLAYRIAPCRQGGALCALALGSLAQRTQARCALLHRLAQRIASSAQLADRVCHLRGLGQQRLAARGGRSDATLGRCVAGSSALKAGVAASQSLVELAQASLRVRERVERIQHPHPAGFLLSMRVGQAALLSAALDLLAFKLVPDRARGAL